MRPPPDAPIARWNATRKSDGTSTSLRQCRVGQGFSKSNTQNLMSRKRLRKSRCSDTFEAAPEGCGQAFVSQYDFSASGQVAVHHGEPVGLVRASSVVVQTWKYPELGGSGGIVLSMTLRIKERIFRRPVLPVSRAEGPVGMDLAFRSYAPLNTVNRLGCSQSSKSRSRHCGQQAQKGGISSSVWQNFDRDVEIPASAAFSRAPCPASINAR